MALDVHLVTPEREVWTGSADMVVARGTDGMVGIMQDHAPLLIRLAIGVLRIQVAGGRWEGAVVDGGFLHVTDTDDATRVDILATHAELASEIDRLTAERRADEARARLAQGEDVEARSELAKALARTGLSG